MKALSIRQPWASAILLGGKRIENRSRKDGRMPAICAHRGPLLLHASKGCTVAEDKQARAWMASQGLTPKIPLLRLLPRAGIVGKARAIGALDPRGMLVDGFTRDPGDLAALRRWHDPGQWGLILADVEPLPFVPWSGALGLHVPPVRLRARGRRPVPRGRVQAPGRGEVHVTAAAWSPSAACEHLRALVPSWDHPRRRGWLRARRSVGCARLLFVLDAFQGLPMRSSTAVALVELLRAEGLAAKKLRPPFGPWLVAAARSEYASGRP